METVKVKEDPDMRMKPSTVITSDQHRHRNRGERRFSENDYKTASSA